MGDWSSKVFSRPNINLLYEHELSPLRKFPGVKSGDFSSRERRCVPQYIADELEEGFLEEIPSELQMQKFGACGTHICELLSTGRISRGK